MGVPSGTVVGRTTLNSPRTSTGCVPSGVSTITGRPSASSRYSSQWCTWSASCQPTSILSAIPDGIGSGPVRDQPPPSTKSFPSATCAASHNSIVTFTPGRLQPVASCLVPDALRDDVYRRPLATALERLRGAPGWRGVGGGAGWGGV